MGFKTFMVVLDPEQPIYFSGQTVKGYVRVGSTEDIACRKITIILKGMAKVRWSESQGKSSRVYSSYEQYFRHQIIAWSGEGSGNTMGPGDKIFPFSYVLPQGIPPSFASPFGGVIYQVKAVAEVPWGFNQKRKVFFSVNVVHDLNDAPPATEKMSLEKSKSVMFAKGAINLSMSAERTGYVPGESIVVNGEVVNHSKSTIKYTEIKLLQIIMYLTKEKRKNIYRTVQRVYHPELAGGGQDVWSSVPLQVPAVPPTFLDYCSIITIHYFLQMKAKLSFSREVREEVPVIIGSLPLKTTYSTFHPHPVPALFGGAAAASTANPSDADYSHSSFGFSHPSTATAQDPYSADPPPDNPSGLPQEFCGVPSPSYAYCVFGEDEMKRRAQKNDAKKDIKEEKFVPRYMIYKTAK